MKEHDQLALPCSLTVFIFIIISWKETGYGKKDQRRTENNIRWIVQCF